MNIQALIAQALETTVQSLTGQESAFAVQSSLTSSDLIIDEHCQLFLEWVGTETSDVCIILPAKIASTISSTMLDVKPDPKSTLTQDDEEALKDFARNFVDTLNNSLESDGVDASVILNGTKLGKTANDIEQSYSSGLEVEIIFVDLELNEKSGYFFASNQSIFNLSLETGGKLNGDSLGKFELKDHHFSKDQLKNLNLILDVKVEIKVRIGSKKMFLKDAINMDIGSVVELDKLLTEPLDILIDNKLVGHGEVVIVDGNFGVRVTDIVDPIERLESLREN